MRFLQIHEQLWIRADTVRSVSVQGREDDARIHLRLYDGTEVIYLEHYKTFRAAEEMAKAIVREIELGITAGPRESTNPFRAPKPANWNFRDGSL